MLGRGNGYLSLWHLAEVLFCGFTMLLLLFKREFGVKPPGGEKEKTNEYNFASWEFITILYI
jgi:hypothetical protein